MGNLDPTSPRLAATDRPAGTDRHDAGLGTRDAAAAGRPGEDPGEEIDMRIAVDGTWFYRGSPIARMPLVRLFASVLRREAGGYWLVTPVERCRVAVDDAPFTAVDLLAGPPGAATLTFRTNIDAHVTAGPDHPILVTEDPDRGEPRPYVEVRPGLWALILRPVFYQLAELAEIRPAPGGGDEWGVWSAGRFFRLGGA